MLGLAQRIAKLSENPKTWRRVHLTMTTLWMLLIIPSLLWWKDSILWVILMSCWANVASHFSAWQATRSEDAD